MYEIITDAIVLDKQESGDFDALVTLYTEELGKVSARAKSSRKITSKLSAHIEPGALTTVRLIARNPFVGPKTTFQLVDGLIQKKLFNDFAFLDAVKKTTLEFHNDRTLWDFLIQGGADPGQLLAIVGFGSMQSIQDL